MAWFHRSHRVSTLASSAVLLLACGDNGGRDDSTTTQATVNPTAITVTTTTTSEPTASVSDSDTPTTSGSMSATDSGTTGTSSTGTTGPVTATDTTDATTGPGPCPMGQIECEGNTAKVCDGMGGFTSEMPCAQACAPGLGCVLCVPGSYQCVGDLSQVCNDDGSAWVDAMTCDAVQGLSCDVMSGACIGACAGLGNSYIGCDYYPVVTQQIDGYLGPNPYAVAVANTTAQAANITVTQGANPIAMDMVPANSVKVIQLPVVNALNAGSGPTILVPDGAYRLRSTQPVTVYQYNPLNADVTNDASLMLPVNTWTGNYLVAAWQNWDGLNLRGWYSVTASKDNTMVTVKARGGGVPTQAGGGVDGQGNGVIVMNEGDVLQVITENGGDLTGTIVTADKPVQVLGGHECTQVPIGVTACDHLEESMFPIETLAKEYIVVPPVQVPNDAAEKAVIVRIVAAEANTTLTFEPDQAVNKLLANAGDFVEIPPTIARFVVKADKKILVAEYMVGQDGGYGTSDPAMLLAVPTAQFRKSYLFYAQPAWSANYVDIIAPAGANVTVDGAPVANFTPVAASGFSLAHVKLSNAGDGSHSVAGDQGIGISVYGVIDYGSYWYPGGLDLDVIPQ
jgi:hypothetical protein